MSREERRIFQIGVLVAAVLIIEMVAVKTEGCNRIDAYAAPAVQFEEITEESSEAAEKGLFDANSAMPCVDAESFRRWMETYEPETTEEARSDDSRTDHEVVREEAPTLATEPETTVESTGPAIYRIAGETIDESIQVRLYQHLQEAGIPYWYEGALCQMFQESHGQQYAVNPNNGIDCGLYQYRSTFWTEPVDIFDVDAQLRRYASEMAARFNAGLSVDEAISRHMTSDFVSTINREYVSDVKQWLGRLEAIE